MSAILKTNNFESVILEKAKGSWVWDTTGKKYLDCTSGTWCINLGHNHPKIIEVIKKQVDKLIHRNMRFLTPEVVEASNNLLDYIPGNYDKVTYLNSGSEAMEFSINFAKKATKKSKILSLQGAYLGAFGTAKSASLSADIESKMKIPYPACETSNCDCRSKFETPIEQIISDKETSPACFVFEPIMVSGGIFRPCKNFIQLICEKIRKNNGLIIVDEVTTGFGRTGSKFGYEYFDITPDIIAIGKAFGNGYPVSAVITRSEFEIRLTSADLYHAQSHQLDPLGVKISNEVISIIQSENIIEKVPSKRERILEALSDINHPKIKEIRSFGMIFGLVLQDISEPETQGLIMKIKDKLLEEGVIVGYSTIKNLIRLLPPLTLSNNEINFLQNKLQKIFGELTT